MMVNFTRWTPLQFLLRLAAMLQVLNGAAYGGEIHDAVARGDVETVRRLLATNSDLNIGLVNSRNGDGATPLLCAVGYENQYAANRAYVRPQKIAPAIVELLLAKHADLNACDHSQRTALHYAVLFNLKEIVELLVDNKAAVNAKDRRGETPLHLAASNGNTNSMSFLLQHGADVNSRAQGGDTPLVITAEAKMNAASRLLLDHGADVSLPGNFGTPLTRAVLSSDKDLIALLLAHKADINARDGRWGIASEQAARNRDTLEFVMKSGAKPCIFSAVALNNAEQVGEFLTSDPSLANATDYLGCTPLYLAATLGNAQMAKYLLARGANIDAPGWRGTPLCEAAISGDTNMAKLLLVSGAKSADSALICAAQKRRKEMVALLLSCHAKINGREWQGLTALHCAAHNGDLDMMSLLSKHGADVNLRSNLGETPQRWTPSFGRVNAEIKLGSQALLN
jgi:serine/threonine-protein phosphatase 6 regulatory ankyrin repeat subunit B